MSQFFIMGLLRKHFLNCSNATFTYVKDLNTSFPASIVGLLILLSLTSDFVFFSNIKTTSPSIQAAKRIFLALHASPTKRHELLGTVMGS